MKKCLFIFTILLLLFHGASLCLAQTPLMEYAERQLTLGPRTPNSDAHAAFIADTVDFLRSNGWTVTADKEKYRGRGVTNIIADRNPDGEAEQWLMVGAHFDSRILADQDSDPAARLNPVPGANDGASGVAVLMRLAETLPLMENRRVTLAFFDAEDQGNLTGWADWCLGSALLAEQMSKSDILPDAVVVVDMVGDANLNIYREQNSHPALTDRLFNIAADLGYKKQFINKEKYRMMDDHIPFAQLGIPSADLIDFDYPHWHTSQDTADKLSEESLQKVYRVVYTWLTEDDPL